MLSSMPGRLPLAADDWSSGVNVSPVPSFSEKLPASMSSMDSSWLVGSAVLLKESRARLSQMG